MILIACASKHKKQNPLLGLGIGADGLKTGHQEAGYGLVGSATQDGRHNFVLSGLDGLEAEHKKRKLSLTGHLDNLS